MRKTGCTVWLFSGDSLHIAVRLGLNFGGGSGGMVMEYDDGGAHSLPQAHM